MRLMILCIIKIKKPKMMPNEMIVLFVMQLRYNAIGSKNY